MLRCMPAGGDETFCAEAAEALASLPGVRAVALGGSRAAGTGRWPLCGAASSHREAALSQPFPPV